MQAPPTTGPAHGAAGTARAGAEYPAQPGARRQLPPGAAYAPQHAPVAAPPPPPPPARLVESPVNYSRPLSVSPAPPPLHHQQQHSNSAPPALHTRRSFIGPAHLASPSSSSAAPTPAPGAPSTRTAAASGMSLATQLPAFVPAVAFSPEDRGPYPPLASPTREPPAAEYLDAAAQGASSSSAAAAAAPAHALARPRSLAAFEPPSSGAVPRVGLEDLGMAGVGTRASLILPSLSSSAVFVPGPAPCPSPSPASAPLLSPPRTGAPTPARSPQLVAASPYASAPAASAALVSASPVGGAPAPAAQASAQGFTAPPGAPPKPAHAPQPPPHLVPQPEVCVECMMRDRDMADVDVTGARVWERDSDAEWDEQCRWEAAADQQQQQQQQHGVELERLGGPGSYEAGSSESGGAALGGVRRSVYERESSSAHTGAGAGGRRRLGKGQLLTSGNLKVWTTMNPPAAAHRWRTLQTFLATQAHYLELDRQARIREASAAAAASSSPHGPSPIELVPAAAASNAPRNRASSLLSPESLAAEKAALEHEERVALRAIKSRSRATLADETNLHQHQHLQQHPQQQYPHQLAGSLPSGNQSFRHSSASLLPPPSLYNGNGGGNASSGSSMRSYSAGDQPWLGPALRRLSSPSAAPAGASQLSASPPKSPATSMASSRFAFPKFARSSTDLRSLPPGTGTGTGGATPRSVSPARTSGDGSARRPTSMWSRFRQSASAASVLSFAPSGSMMDMHLGLEQDQRAGLAAAGGPGYGSLGHYGGGAAGGGAAMYAAQYAAGAGAGAGYGFGSPQQVVYDAYGAAAMSDPAVARHADRRERERVLAETAAAREAAAAAAAAEAEHGAGKKKKKGLKGFFNKLVGGSSSSGGRARSRTLGSSSAPATPGVDRGAPFDTSLGPGSRYGADDDELAPPPPLSALANEPRYHLRSGSSSSVDSLGPYTPPLPPQQQFRQSYHMPMPGGAHAADRQSILTLGSFTSTRSNGGGGNKPSGGAGARASTVPSRNSWVGRPSLDSVRRPGSFGGGPALGGSPGDAETEVLAGGVDDLDLDPEQQQHDDVEHELLQPPPHPRSQKSLPLLPSEATYRGSPSPHGASSPYDPYHAVRAAPPAGYDAPPAAAAGPYGNYGASRSAYTLGSNPAADSRASLAQEFGLVGCGEQEPQHTVRKSRSRHKVFSLSFGSNSGKKGQHRQSSAEPTGSPPPPPLPQPSAARGASLDSASAMRYAEAYDGRPQGDALVGGMR